MKPRVEIHYCHSCGLLPRATWLAQELLNAFERELGEVALLPADAGVFDVYIDSERLHSRDYDGGFPDPVAIKRAIRGQL